MGLVNVTPLPLPGKPGINPNVRRGFFPQTAAQKSVDRCMRQAGRQAGLTAFNSTTSATRHLTVNSDNKALLSISYMHYNEFYICVSETLLMFLSEIIFRLNTRVGIRVQRVGRWHTCAHRWYAIRYSSLGGGTRVHHRWYAIR